MFLHETILFSDKWQNHHFTILHLSSNMLRYIKPADASNLSAASDILSVH